MYPDYESLITQYMCNIQTSWTINLPILYFKSFFPPKLFIGSLKPKCFTYSPLLPTLSPNTKHSHTGYCRIAHKWCTAGIVFSSILFTKRKAYSICFKSRNFTPIDRDNEPFKGIPLFYFTLNHGSTIKSD